MIGLTNENLSTYTINENTKFIDADVFSGCHRLTSIIIPNGVIYIGGMAFWGCKLESIVIPDSITNISGSTFWGCGNLTSIVIPDSITFIGAKAFCDCTSLTDVYYTGTAEEWRAIIIEGSNEEHTSATIHYNYTDE